MAMTLRPDPHLARDLRAQSRKEGRSMQSVALTALREYIDRHRIADEVDEALDVLTPRYANLLKRLGDS